MCPANGRRYNVTPSLIGWAHAQNEPWKCSDITDEQLTHWGRVAHICVSKLIIIGSDNGLPPGRRQAIIWTNAGILLIGHLGTNFSEILIQIHTFSFKKMHLKMSSAKWRPFCLGLNVLRHCVSGQPSSFRCSTEGRGYFIHAYQFFNLRALKYQ